MPHEPARRSRRQRPGADPADLSGMPERPSAPVRLSHYSPSELISLEVPADSLGQWPRPQGITWIDVAAPNASDFLALREQLDFHPSALSLLAYGPHRPRYVAWPGLEALVLVRARGDATLEQVCIILGDRWVLSVSEKAGKHFELVHERLEDSESQLRCGSAALLASTLILTLMDQCFEPIERLREDVEELLDTGSDPNQVPLSSSLRRIRQELHRLRRIEPMPEAIRQAQWGHSQRWDADALANLRTAEEGARHLVEIIEAARDLAGTVADQHLAILQARSNGGISFLTLVSTIFLPTTFLVGLWGMNFRYMPELEWRYGYVFALTIIVLSATLLTLLIMRQAWFRGLREAWKSMQSDEDEKPPRRQ